MHVVLTRVEDFKAGNTLITAQTFGVSCKIHARLPVKVLFISLFIFAIDGFQSTLRPTS